MICSYMATNVTVRDDTPNLLISLNFLQKRVGVFLQGYTVLIKDPNLTYM